MVPSGILLSYLVLVMFTIALVFVYLLSQRPQINITIICGGRETVIREGVINGSGLLFRSRNGDMINLGGEFAPGMKVKLVRA